MNKYAQELRTTAKAMMAEGKGILAMDESNGTCNKRFAQLGIATTEENRRAYRELILTAPNLSNYISGAILYDETIRQSTADGKSFVKVMQEAGMIPGIKVDTGAKDLAGHNNEKVTEKTLHEVFRQLYVQNVAYDQMILKPSMVISGASCSIQAKVEQVATETIRCLLNTVPPAVPGIAFLSGGQSKERSSAHLNYMNANFRSQFPWRVTFSYARAIQQPALEHWRGIAANVAEAQKLLVQRAKLNSAASEGTYSEAMEKQPALV